MILRNNFSAPQKALNGNQSVHQCNINSKLQKLAFIVRFGAKSECEDQLIRGDSTVRRCKSLVMAIIESCGC